jgi:Ca2+-binding RTX toxin-like protein
LDVLIGGDGSDRIVGSSGVDIVIAGTTVYDAHDAALRAILAEWSSGAALESRVADLRDGSVQLPDGTQIVLQAGVTVLNDSFFDKLTGSNGPDWLFFDEELDMVTDLDPDQDVINDGPVP